MKVREIMTREVVTTNPSATVAQVARLMLDHHLSGLPIVDDSGRPVGVLSETDLVAKHARVHLPRYIELLGGVLPFGARESDRDIRHALATTAAELMTRAPETVSPETDVDDAATLMVEKGANPLPVVENGRLVGIISQMDIIRLLLLEEGGENEE
jgi:CBS domain-containing protein